MADVGDDYSFPKNKIKILLLENCHQQAIDLLRSETFQVEALKGSLGEDELCEKVKDIHWLGVRSKTKVTQKVLQSARRLLGVGCFCIGTDQVDLNAAALLGIPVFNAPFANTRSVAELMIAEIIALSRCLGDRSKELHDGTWNKVAAGCNEVRGKTCGIIGYGHVGSQVSILAEMMGMKVIFYDVVPKLPLGNAEAVETLDDLLAKSDYVLLHVPSCEATKNMITATEINKIKKGAFLLNASRGTVVDLDALAAAMKSGHLKGCAVDVYPSEPKNNGPGFVTPLQGCPNTILTPHIGGSTEEAQAAIGVEVARKIIALINTGSSLGAVNFPEVDLPALKPAHHRVMHVHNNVPGVLRAINNVLAEVNVVAQSLRTEDKIGYLLADVEKEVSDDIKTALDKLDQTIKTRTVH
jgi:D-3-phosphoglycerate dehydrogenase